MKFLQKKTKKGLKTHKEYRVVFWWNTAIFLFLAVNVLMVLACLYVFREVDRGEFFVSQKTERTLTQVIDPEKLRAVVEQMDARQVELDRLRQTDMRLVDPSL